MVLRFSVSSIGGFLQGIESSEIMKKKKREKFVYLDNQTANEVVSALILDDTVFMCIPWYFP